jgi:hypothetical protein
MNDATEVNNALKKEGRVTMASDKERTTEKVNDKSSIKVCKDRPYRVSGVVPLFELTVATMPIIALTLTT